ncbi:hypothetical protein HD806DRAFT_548761 [Xylariaceae sp. AK1471]|nr:hypothetical protein HD806DRAFT_548761 [Xylariaceae sp. AK1471]
MLTMADRFELGLKAFEISSKGFNLSLSVTSAAFIYDVPLHNATHDELSSLIQSKQLWLLPRGLCRLELRVKLRECDICGEESAGFLEFIADRICQSSLWSQLDLTVKILAVQCHADNDNIPNLYFNIEQPDMSSALLSPPHAHTAQFKGLECILRFKTLSRLEASTRGNELIDLEHPSFPDLMLSLAGVPTDNYTFDASDLGAEPWENAAYMVEAALYFIFGMRQRFRNLTILKLEEAPSLLELAPAVWNSHYLKSTVNHVKNFAVISNILASSVNAQSPDLRRKGAGLLEENPSGANRDCNRETEHAARRLESSVQRRLWDLLQATLKPTIGTSKTATQNPPSMVELDNQYPKVSGPTINEGSVDQYNMSYEHQYPYQPRQPPPELGYYHFQSSASYHSGSEYVRQRGVDLSLLQDDEVPEPSELEVRTGGLSGGYELSETHDDYLNLDSPGPMQDYPMPDYLADGDVYGWEYDHAGAAGQGLTDYELALASTSY